MLPLRINLQTCDRQLLLSEFFFFSFRLGGVVQKITLNLHQVKD